MNMDIDFERCKSFIDCQLRSTGGSPAPHSNVVTRPTITFSRQTGSGAQVTAQKLADFLNKKDTGAPFPWTVFDKNLVHKVIEDHHLPQRLAQYIGEDKKSPINDAVEELLGLHPSQWTLVEQTTDTICRLAQMGNIILLGRGAAIIASHLDNALHVRLVGSVECRTARLQKMLHLSQKEAQEHLIKEDRNRKNYLKTYFSRDIEDPLLYHITVNTDLVELDDVAQMLGDIVLRRIARSTQN